MTLPPKIPGSPWEVRGELGARIQVQQYLYLVAVPMVIKVETMKSTDARQVHYKIIGTLAVSVMKGETVLSLVPAQGYLSPDKKFGIAFPEPKAKEKAKKKAQLLRLVDDSCQFESIGADISSKLTEFIAIAANQKAVALIVDNNHRVVGFKFPAA